uniref:10 kDa heat shock protein, mitochondrial n=1 Tax=Dastarcus helophoroides TaxID=1169899 RepID=A0A166IKW5_9CUCU|nr:small heat shock protein [Dastarcus helophoroides]
MAETLKRLSPLFNRVLVKKADAATQSKGGIFLPETSRAKVMKGTVVAVGPGNKNNNGETVPLSIKVGDNVLLPDYGGTKVDFGDQQEFFIFREPDILAKLNK